MAKVSRLADPEFAKLVADLYLAGHTREEICNLLPEPKPVVDTISVWTADPRVQVHIKAGSAARVARITRRIDREIEARITGGSIEKIDLETLLRIRKELKGKVPEAAENETATSDIWDVLDGDPELVERITKAAKGG